MALSTKTQKIVVSIVLLLILPFAIGRGPITNVSAGSKSLVLYASIAGWNSSEPSGPNPTIVVNHGDSLSFNLIGADSSTHLLLVDVDRDGSSAGCQGTDKCSNSIGQGQTVPFSLALNFAPGSYTYYCFYHPNSMLGKLNVTAIPDFSLNLSHASIAVPPGTSSNTTVSMTSQGGFTGNITVSTVPIMGLTASASPSKVSLTANGTSSTVLTISAVSSDRQQTSPGVYTVNVTGSSGSIFHSALLQVTVIPPPSCFCINTFPIFGIVAVVAVVAVVVAALYLPTSRRRTGLS